MIIAIVFMAVVLLLITTLIGYVQFEANSQRKSIGKVKAVNIAEAGIEKALWKLNNEQNYSGESNTVYADGVYNIAITTLSGNSKLIRADAYVPSSSNPISKSSVQVTATTGTTNISFNYGVQVGLGGLDMSNSAQIIGNVYSNGDIVGTNSARIQGTAIVAGVGIISGMDVDGNATAYQILSGSAVGGSTTSSGLSNTSVGGNLVADSISNCTVGGNATYDTRIGCNIGGVTTTPNPNPYQQQPVQELPITEEQIDIWEEDAAAGGVIGTQSYSSGTRNLGPKKINGDLFLSNDAEMVVTGTLWVTGQIRLSNTSVLRLSSSYGSQGGVVLAGIDESSTAGYIELSNSAQALGSGSSGSYIMLLSQKEGTGSQAIRSSNTGSAAIFYAGEGWIEIGNTAELKEITAQKLTINNNATVTYESGLANSNFSSGPAGGWEILDQTWQTLP